MTARDLAAVQQRAEAVVNAKADLRSAIASALDAGHSWSEIGRVLGVTRQAAWQRFRTTTSRRAS